MQARQSWSQGWGERGGGDAEDKERAQADKLRLFWVKPNTKLASRRLSLIHSSISENSTISNQSQTAILFFFHKFIFIYLFLIFGCVGSSLLRVGFL